MLLLVDETYSKNERVLDVALKVSSPVGPSLYLSPSNNISFSVPVIALCDVSLAPSATVNPPPLPNEPTAPPVFDVPA